VIVRALLLSLIVLHPGVRAAGEVRHRERIPLESSWSFVEH
jgi:hypothetical protein